MIMRLKRFQIVAEASVAETIKAMVMNSHGLAWLPESYISKELNDGSLIIFNELDAIKINIHLIRYKLLHQQAEFVWNQMS